MKELTKTVVAVATAATIGIVMSASLVAMNTSTFHTATASSVPKAILNSSVSQSTIKQTICTSGYTKSIRPSSHYTNDLKVLQIKTLHLADTDPTHYEEDHWIPLELGGHPTDPRNLWPEPWADAKPKDKLENNLHAQVCKGTITLEAAQYQMYVWRH